MSETERTHLELRLLGSRYGDGEIPLDGLARIATETQRLVRRLARALTDRGGAGRTPAAIEELTSLLLVGLRDGSTVLDIAGPPLQAELDLGDDVASDVGTQAVLLLLDTLEAAGDANAPLPNVIDEKLAGAVDRWMGAMEDYDGVELRSRARSEERRLDVVPRQHMGVLSGRLEGPRVASESSEAYVAEGTLYAVNLHTGRYTLEDDTGHSFPCIAEDADPALVGELLGKRVRAAGEVTRDVAGRVKALAAARLSAATPVPGLDREAFWRRTSREELLRNAKPLESLDELIIDGLTEEEEEAFLEALRE